MLNLSLLTLILVPVLVYWLSRKPRAGDDVMTDYIVPRDTEVRTCATHWGVPAGVTRLNSALLTQVKCHPDFVERDVPEQWFKWSPADARRRARQRAMKVETSGVFSIRKHA